jgi:hypothetical protein
MPGEGTTLYVIVPNYGHFVRFVPNPGGKAGGPEHQARVAQARADLEAKYCERPDIRIQTEVPVETPAGEKARRYIDVAAVTAGSMSVLEGIQVGRQTAAGQPIARERRALCDIRAALPGVTIDYRPYYAGQHDRPPERYSSDERGPRAADHAAREAR